MTSRLLVAAGAIVAFLLALPAGAGATELGVQHVGTSAGTFLKIGIGARPVAMGGAFVAVANDPSAIYWNPAGIAGLLRNQVFVSHVDWPAEVDYEFLAAVFPVAKLGGSVGIQMGSLRADIEETTELAPYGTGRTFTYTDYVAGLSYASRLTDKLLLGGTFKYIHENLGLDVGGTTVNTWVIDVGSIYYIGWSSLRIGVTLANFGPDFSPSGEYYSSTGEVRAYDSFNPPTQFRWGLAMEPVESEQMAVTTAFEVSQPADNQQAYKLGLEWSLRRTLALRGGYDFNADALKWSAGAGVLGDVGVLRGTVDYAYTDGDELGSIHQFTLGVRF
jgi:hypothetical protein